LNHRWTRMDAEEQRPLTLTLSRREREQPLAVLD
jgi:hypothetical protein